MILPRSQRLPVEAFAGQQQLSEPSPSLWAAFLASKDEDQVYWSSLIGISTAIIGNILISFALNLQRYAHIRIARKQEEAEGTRRKLDSRRNSGIDAPRASISYGTQDSTANNQTPRPSTDRLDGIRKSSDGRQAVNGRSGPQEAQPLIPRANGNGPTDDDDTTTDGSHATLTNRIPRSEDEESTKPAQQSYLQSPYWWAGIITMTIGEAGNFLAYGFAPASIVSPLGVVSLVSNCLIAPLMLKESFRKRDFLGVLIAITGAVTIVMSASDNNPKLGPKKIWHLIATWEFQAYLVITLILIITLMYFSPRYGHQSILIDLGIVALCGGYTALSTKGVASLLSYKVFRILTFPVTYLLVLVLVGTAILQIRYINLALQRFNSTEVIPTQFVLFTISVIIGSAILYRDFERTSGREAAEFCGGCMLTFTGVWFITSHRSRGGENEEEESDVHGQRIRLPDDQVMPHRGSYQDAPDSPAASPRRPSHPASRLSDASGPISPSISNPWASHPSPPASPSSARPVIGSTALPATTSAPILPSEAQILSPDSEDPLSPLLPESPQTPRRSASVSVDLGRPDDPGVPLIAPGGSARASRDLSRDSGEGVPTLIPGVGLVPGPFIAPGSGSVSTVVADSLRRGFRGKARLRSGSGDAWPRLSEIHADEPRAGSLDIARPTNPSLPEEEATGRHRSLSGSLGDWFNRTSSEAVNQPLPEDASRPEPRRTRS